MKSGHIYLDESGDLGWKLSAPYRNGGSSRYLTIGYLLCDITCCNIPKRLVRDFYSKYNFSPKKEIKASDLKGHHKDYICAETVKMMEKHTDFVLGAITVNKSKVESHIRHDPDVLYNYMICEAIIEKIENYGSCKISRDNRTVKIASGKSCIDYLQALIWMHRKKKTILIDNPTHSHTDNGVIFIDWITNIVWTKYEDNYGNWCNALKNSIEEKRIFF